MINALFSVANHGLWGQINPFFWAGMILVITGAVMVLVFAPRGEKSPEPRVESREPETRMAQRNRWRVIPNLASAATPQLIREGSGG